MIRIIFFLLAFCFQTAQANWVQMASLPSSPRFGQTSFVIDSKIIIVGGVNSSSNYLNETWEYNTVSNSWTQKANFPLIGILEPSSFVYNHIGYVLAGYTGASYLKTNYAYSLATNTWTQKNDFLGSERYTGNSFVVNGLAYFGMGFPNSGSNCFNDLWVYNPSLDTWVNKSNLNGSPRQSAISFSLNNKGFVGLGSNTQSSNFNHLNDLWEYDPTLNSWTQKASLPGSGRGSCDVTTYLGCAYVAGGQSFLTSTSPITYYNEIWRYNEINNSWMLFTYLPSTRSNCMLKEFNGSLYFGLGRNTSILNSFNDFWKYTIDSIVGPQSNCKNSNAVSYNAPTVNGATYLWTVPTNVTIANGQGTNSISTNWANNAASGNVQVAIIINTDTTLLSLPVQVNTNSLYINPQTICNGSSYSINGNSYSAAGVYFDTISVANSCDSIVRTEITVLTPNLSLNNIEICQGDGYAIGNNVYNLPGVYIDTLNSIVGCDSIIVTNLSVKTIDTSIAIVSGVLLANQAGAFYQWCECTIQGVVPIPGAINQFYNAQTNGNYALILEYNNCIDTTACLNINLQGINNSFVKNTDLFVKQNANSFEFISNSTIYQLRIYNQVGQQLAMVKPNINTFVIDKDKLENGVLFYSILAGNYQANGKIFVNR